MQSLQLALLAPILFLTSAASVGQPADPLRFFEGRTETHGTMKVIFKRTSRSSSVGYGRIERDGSLTLVQRVNDDGKPPHERRWRVRQTGPGRFTGMMSEAAGPITIEKAGNRYRFRFMMNGKLDVEQWLTPLPGNRSASSITTVRRFGMTVATAQAMIRKTS